ncbi:type 1 glutamine amidotransferase domain-containing protein [Streptomyces sp. CAU 1734]|uniref:type 1 glutamine amidotransferase domain-containing protein n=1 Tax=Streptomyces sp. CAU 1734 TaxID=3140360 RepID=UPI003261CCE2
MPAKSPPPKGLIVLSSVDRLPNGRPAGFWLPEAAYPWRALLAAGWDYEFVSTRPGRPAARGVDRSDPPQRMFLEDTAVREKLDRTTTPDLRDPAEFGIVFIAGGHGSVLDLPADTRLSAMLGACGAARAVIAAIGHGVGALLNVRRRGGGSLTAGRRVTAFTRHEESMAGLDRVMPYSLEDALRAQGARFESGDPFQPYVVTDGHLVTGQNPASCAELAAAGMALATGRTLPARWPRQPVPAHG